MHTEEKQMDLFRLQIPSYFRHFTIFPSLEEKIPSFDCKPILDVYKDYFICTYSEMGVKSRKAGKCTGGNVRYVAEKWRFYETTIYIHIYVIFI